jgi:hypothetical protein
MNVMNFSQVNISGSVLAKNGFDIFVTAAISGFTANGLSIPVSTTNQLYLSNAPLLVTGNITNAAAGTIFYYYEANAKAI